MTTNRWTAIAATCGLVGGLCWILKVVVITAAGGVDGGVDVPLFAVGLALLLVGATGVGLWLTRTRPTWLRVLAAVLAPVLGLGLFVLAQIVTEPLNPLGPVDLDGEYGILLAAAAGLLLGIWRLRRPRRAPAVADR